jgi:hypothetical protein
LNNGVLRRVEMGARVPVLRGIATAYVAALQAHAQMKPRVAHLQTLFAPLGMRLYLLYVIRNVTAFDCHS